MIPILKNLLVDVVVAIGRLVVEEINDYKANQKKERKPKI